MATLFAMPNAEQANTNGDTCGKCANAVRPHHYRQDWLYCAITPCGRSRFGIKRVRSRQESCHQFSNVDLNLFRREPEIGSRCIVGNSRPVCCNCEYWREFGNSAGDGLCHVADKSGSPPVQTDAYSQCHMFVANADLNLFRREPEIGSRCFVGLSPVFWEHEDELPKMSDDDFGAIFGSSRLSEGACGVRVYPYVKDAHGNKIFISKPNAENHRQEEVKC